MLAKLTNVLLIVLSLTLGFFFMFVGILKLTPAVKEDIHEEMQKQFVRMAKVFPLADMLDFKVDPDFYRTAVGVVEVVCGIILAMIPGCVREVANSVLLLLMLGALYTLYALGEGVDKMVPAIVCGALLLLRLVARKLVCASHSSCYSSKATADDAHTKSD